MNVQVQVVRGLYKGQSGKVISVYRKKWVIHIERIQKEKANGATVSIGFDPSKVIAVSRLFAHTTTGRDHQAEAR